MYYISKKSCHSAIDYAADELKKYLHMMMPDAGCSEIVCDSENKDGFRLGLMQDFGLDVSDAEDTELDDILYIDTTENGGIIAGDNPRAVLLAVYEYLRQNGCRWLFPGIDGEFVPMKDISPVKYRHMASMRFRGWCNEGSCTQKSLLDMIEFAPRAGFNVCNIQFRIPTVFYDRYYEHQHNIENRPFESVTKDQMLQWTRQGEHEIKKRGMIYYAIGHGMTVDPFGISAADTWRYMPDDIIPDETRPYLAEIDGKRGFFPKAPAPCNTNFCMSNPEARKIVVDYAADFMEKHPYIDYLSFALADQYNNHCECEECRKKRPSDWNVILMNELDTKFTERGLKNKVAFSAYTDTTWPPLTEKINNPERFVLKFSPSTRDKTKCLDDVIPEPKPYVRNKIQLIESFSEALGYLREWKKVWKGPVVASEYLFWSAIYNDPSCLKVAERFEEDLKCFYKEYGFDGLIHFISMRNFFPNGYAFYANARLMFDINMSLEEIKKDYFSCAYGDYADEVIGFFEKVKEVFDFKFIEGKAGVNGRKYYNPEISEKLKLSKELSGEAIAISGKMECPAARVQSISKKLLYYYGIYLEYIGRFLQLKAAGDDEGAKKKLDEFKVEFGKFEPEINDYYDHYMVNKMYLEISNNVDFLIQ